MCYRTSENCQSLILQDKCNIELFLSPVVLADSLNRVLLFMMIKIHIELSLVLYWSRVVWVTIGLLSVIHP